MGVDDGEPVRVGRRVVARPLRSGWWWRQARFVRVAILLSGVALIGSCPASVAIYFMVRSVNVDRAENSESPSPGLTWKSGSLEVEVIDAEITEDNSLFVFVTVRTSDDRKSVNFTGWRRLGFGSVAMRDDARNTYTQKKFDPVIDGGIADMWNARPSSKNLKFGPGQLTSDQGRIEILVFPKPPPGIQRIDLELSGRAIGQSGPVRLSIPASMWKEIGGEPPRRDTPKKGRR